MIYQIEYVALIVIFGFCTFGVAMADTDYERLKHIADKIVAKIPGSWRVIGEKTGVIPYGHYNGLKYEGSGGLSVVLEGDRNVFCHWKNKNGVWHQEALAKESLEIWIMPPEYHQSWKRFFIMKTPVPAEKIYSGKEAKVYSYPTHHIESREEFEKIISSLPAVITSWPDSPHHTGILSWVTWKEDIKEVLQGSE